MVTHVIFDMDGLLLDTEALYSEALQHVIDPYNKILTYDVKLKILGRRPLDYARIMIEHYQLPMEPQQFLERLDVESEQIFPGCKWMPGIPKLIHHLYKNRVPMAISTSSGVEGLRLKMRHHTKILEMFHHIVTGCDSEVLQGKPAPDIYQVCARRFDGNINANKCLAFEDAPAGVKAASAAGMQVVMIPDPQLPMDDRKDATLVLDSAHGFVPELFGLPAFNYKTVTHVIFDMDGLLLNTTDMFFAVIDGMLTELGKTSDDSFLQQMIGRRQVEVVPMLISRFSLPYTEEEFHKIYYERAAVLWQDCQLLEGVERLILHLYTCGIPMAVATSSTEGAYLEKIRNHRHVFDRFHHVVTGSHPDVKEGKPAPDIFRICATKFEGNVPPEMCLVFEDAPNGVEAADAAGMQSVMIPHQDGVAPGKALQATQFLTSMADFRPEDFGIPPFVDELT